MRSKLTEELGVGGPVAAATAVAPHDDRELGGSSLGGFGNVDCVLGEVRVS